MVCVALPVSVSAGGERVNANGAAKQYAGGSDTKMRYAHPEHYTKIFFAGDQTSLHASGNRRAQNGCARAQRSAAVLPAAPCRRVWRRAPGPLACSPVTLLTRAAAVSVALLPQRRCAAAAGLCLLYRRCTAAAVHAPRAGAHDCAPLLLLLLLGEMSGRRRCWRR